MQGSKVLVIGGNGYIGNMLCRYLDMRGYHVLSVDACAYSTPNEFTTFEGDYDLLPDSTFKTCDAVILLAGNSSVKSCGHDPLPSFDNSVNKFVRLMSKLRSGTKFIYASSSSVYGDTGAVAVDEDYELFAPHNLYDLTKHVIDLYAPMFDVEYYGLRFGTVNGFSPQMRGDVMINAMVDSAMKFGEIKLYNPNVHRPILCINDLVGGVGAILESDVDVRGVYNMASFNSTSGQIANAVGSILDVPVKKVQVQSDHKVYNFWIDSSRFERVFDFKFVGTIGSITDSIHRNYHRIRVTYRNEVYGGAEIS